MKKLTWLLLLLLIIPGLTAEAAPARQPGSTFSFAVAADMRNYAGEGVYDTADYFRGAVEAIAARGQTAFLVAPGDIDPPAGIAWTIAQVFGAGYPWFPVIGNHEIETPGDMSWLRAYDLTHGGQFSVHSGPAGCPETTYSFDYANTHFVMLNQYCDAAGDTVTLGDIPDHLYNWLAADLAASNRAHTFVIGHEPAFPLPDADNGRLRHLGESLDAYPANRDRFWILLKEYGAIYITGHTHNYSAALIDGVWQLDAGHARGLGDTGADSTFLLIQVAGADLAFESYRRGETGGAYLLRHSGSLAVERTFVPLTLGN